MIEFNKIRTIPIKNRKNKFYVKDMAGVNKEVETIDTAEFNELITRIKTTVKNKKQVILMMGAHVIKEGLSNYIIELMKRRIITHIAMNGAGSIHDFEIALIGATSEDVATNVEDGTFGMAEETGRIMNDIIKEAAENDYGLGYAIGKKINDLNLKYKEYSILANAYNLKIPVTIHVAIGTDIIHQHPSCDGAAIGKTSYKDFKIFTESVSKLDEGVLLNIGSAVVLPEVFLKALTVARNLGYKIENITTATFDMIKHYRPLVNVVERPVSLGGKGFYIIEKHEKTIPSLYKNVIGL